MLADVFDYPTVIKETTLDSFGHMNNAVYLTLFEEARWDLITQQGYGLNKIRELAEGPVILEINIKFIKELKARDHINIQSQMISYEEKIGRLAQKIYRGEELCCVAEFVIALFDMRTRKLILPTPAWLKAVGIQA